MAFKDTEYVGIADTKARDIGATCYSDFILKYKNNWHLFSRSYFLNGKPNEDGNLIEVASWSRDMESFTPFTRFSPVNLVTNEKHAIDNRLTCYYDTIKKL